MTNEKTFKASNGYEILNNHGYFDENEDCYEVINNDKFILHRLRPDSLQALREYFRHERDQELGRVRWPENPDYVIYWVPEHDDDEEYRCVRVLHEPTAIRETVLERWVANPARISDLAAKWYFEKGPGKKPERPWEEAKPGEVWRITFAGEEQNAIAEKETGDEVWIKNSGEVWFNGNDTCMNASDPYITAGRKLLNADGSLADD